MSAALDGVLVCDKPAGMTSHDVVARVRRLAGQRRVGHGGTLDPPATGVLVVALGRATRLLPFLPMEPKRYLAAIAFGAETDTLDATGTITGTAPADGIDRAAVERGLAGFLGPQRQVPPMVSAVKLGGERLYLKARRGETVEREPRPVTVHALELLDFRPGPRPCATVAVACSGGTYVRVLAADLGRALGSLAHLVRLRRTAVGAFTEAEAHTLQELEALTRQPRDGQPREGEVPDGQPRDGEVPDGQPREGEVPDGQAREGEVREGEVRGGEGAPAAASREALQSVVIAPAAAMRSVSVRSLSEREAAALSTGQSLEPTGLDEPVAAVGPDGRLVAVIQDGAGRARPRVVLA